MIALTVVSTVCQEISPLLSTTLSVLPVTGSFGSRLLSGTGESSKGSGRRRHPSVYCKSDWAVVKLLESLLQEE